MIGAARRAIRKCPVIPSKVNIREAYNRWSLNYDSDRNRTRDLDRLVIRDVLGDRSYERILEIGCGTGKNTELLSRLARRVYAVDFSAGMLDQAKAKLCSNKVLFVVADLIAPWPFRDQPFELIVCNLVLEHIEDLTSVFSEACRVLSGGGRFFVSELHPFRQYQGKRARFAFEHETIHIPAFVHHLSDFTRAAADAGLSVVSFNEWWHEADENKLPRLVTCIFEKGH